MNTKTLIAKNVLALVIVLVIVIVTGNAMAAERFSVTEWNASFAQALQKKNTNKALELIDFKKLEKKAIPSCVDCTSKAKMQKARSVFAKGDYAAALALYNEIPKSSDLWLQSVEERGWAQFRQGDFEKAIAQAKTLLSPQLVNVADNEGFFLQSLSQLRICDYVGVLETNKKFKDTQREKLVQLQKLTETGTNAELESILTSVDAFPLAFTALNSAPAKLPLLFYRDIEVQKQILKYRIATTAMQTVASTKMSSLANKLQSVKNDSYTLLKARIATLAQEDINSSAMIVQKLNLIEVEAIQRIHSDLGIKENLYKKNDFKQAKDDQLVFMDDDRPWIDELDKYEVAAKVCPRDIRRKM